MPRIEKTIIVRCKQGLHARPAAMFVQLANKYDAAVSVRKGAEEVNGKSIMGILMLGADKGCELVLATDGDDAEASFLELEGFLAKEE
ncbi:MAG: HPr family phosphocarrier protein [Candidatus Omnitrophica bacterium]|nr:HPr family phosphocarrier protein [Candidatus Omnitrophota bacterium]